MENRIVGFDLARAYAIFGMFIVNFNFSFGSIMTNPTDNVGWFLSLFTGNSSAIFIICAGMGVSLLSNLNLDDKFNRKDLKSKIMKRSWFLFLLGLLLYNWWQGDILHFYGGYLHIAAYILFIPKRFYMLFGIIILTVYNILLSIIPVQTSWNFLNFDYIDFWTIEGFLRNTIYNGWNSIFPWFTYFLLGMWLGKLNWNNKKVKQNVFISGSILFSSIEIIRYFAKNEYFTPFWKNFILAEYFPPYLPFIIVTIGFALMAISICMIIGDTFPKNKLLFAIQKTGQMTLSHYVLHLTFGILLFQEITGKKFTRGLIPLSQAISPIYILEYSIFFFAFSIIFSWIWSKKFNNGPLETLMRKISD